MRNFQRSWFLALKFQRDVTYIILPNFQGWSFIKFFFLALKFPRDSTYIILPNFQGCSFCFTWNFQEVQRKIKTIPGFFQKKVCPQSPTSYWVFSSGIAHSKIIDFNWSYEALAQKEALTTCQDRAITSFSCVLSVSSVLGRFTHVYCDTVSLGRGACLHGK